MSPRYIVPPAFHSAHANIAFDRLVRRIEERLSSSVDPAQGHDIIVRKRLAQRIVEIAFNSFVAICHRRLAQGKPPLPPEEDPFECAGLVFDPRSGKVGVSVTLFLRSVLQYLFHWTVILTNFLKGMLFRETKDRRPATILSGVGIENILVNGSDARFVKFCEHGPIAPLRSAQRLLVEVPVSIPSTKPNVITYCKNPLLFALRATPLSARSALSFFGVHAVGAVRFFAALLRQPLLVLLAKDFAYAHACRFLDRQGLLETVVITNAVYASQPLWMRDEVHRKFNVHMVWYSQNIIPHTYAADRVRSDLPNYRHLYANVTWVWTEGFSAYLRRLGMPGEIHVMGPILWYLPESTEALQPHPKNDIQIAVFDVTPVREQVAKEIGLIHNYYRTATSIGFITDIVAVSQELGRATGKRVRILLKHKRGYAQTHDPEYLSLIDELVRNQRVIELIPFQTNIYSLVSDADITIIVPYSSPAYVASAVGRPAIFFDPSAELLPTYEKTPLISFASGRKQLLECLETQFELTTKSSPTGNHCKGERL